MDIATVPNLTFSKDIKKEILAFRDKIVNEEGIIVEKDNPDQKVLAFDGQPLSFEEFGGFKKGSEIFIKNDLVSLMKFSKTG